MNRPALFVCLLAAACAASAPASAFPIGIAVRGGIGNAFYSMSDLNDAIQELSRDAGVRIPDLDGGTNVKIEGRIWVFDRFAAAAMYERWWASTENESGDYTITFKAPADVISFGVVGRIFSFPQILDVNLAAYYSLAETVYGTNILTGRRLDEYKGDDGGFQLAAEAVTNFLNPVEIGIQFGWRNVTVREFENKFGESLRFDLEYGGAFFFLTAGVRL
ncbi:MAG: hypothetical protein JW876_11780 [Candidatus Krumholzibacteriota bacterium]|nr:hypothetical protein [Candidatus Krumholzibacteriota bacterium]